MKRAAQIGQCGVISIGFVGDPHRCPFGVLELMNSEWLHEKFRVGPHNEVRKMEWDEMELQRKSVLEG